MTKLFVDETGTVSLTHRVSRLSRKESVASELAFLEVRSAVRRRQRTGQLTEQNAETALFELNKFTEVIQVFPLNSAVLKAASELVDRLRLRTLDSIQLASALLLAAAEPQAIIFASADLFLLNAARLEGLAIWNPEGE